MNDKEPFDVWLDEFRFNLSCIGADEFELVLRTISDYADRAGADIELISRDDTMSRVAVKLEEARLLWNQRQGN